MIFVILVIVTLGFIFFKIINYASPGEVTKKILQNMDVCLKYDHDSRTLYYPKVRVTMGPYKDVCYVYYKDKEKRWINIDDEFICGDYSLICKKARREIVFQKKKLTAKKKDAIFSALS